jgi:hypothetical protein
MERLLEKYLLKPFDIKGASRHSICRLDYESMPCSMKAWDWSDEKMQALADEISLDFGYDEYPAGESVEDENERESINSDFWLAMEATAVRMGMEYYEDMTPSECEADRNAYDKFSREICENGVQ